MGPTVLVLAALLYLLAAFSYGKVGQWGKLVAFIAYGIANLGFAWDLWRGR